MNLLIKITCRPRKHRDKGGPVEGKSTLEGEAAHRVKTTGRHGEESGARRTRPPKSSAGMARKAAHAGHGRKNHRQA
jgi:hypothetical protein